MLLESSAFLISRAMRRPVDGYGIVYEPHVYYRDDSGPLPPDIDSVILPVAAQYPVFVGEFGTQLDSGAFNSNVITYSESHNLGWAAFAWNAAGPSGWSLLQSWSTYAPSTQGQPVRDEAQRVGGRNEVLVLRGDGGRRDRRLAAGDAGAGALRTDPGDLLVGAASHQTGGDSHGQRSRRS